MKTTFFFILATLLIVSCRQGSDVITNKIEKDTLSIKQRSSVRNVIWQDEAKDNSSFKCLYRSNTFEYLSKKNQSDQFFTYNINSDTTFVCKNGTVIQIPNGIFEFENGKKIPDNSVVTITVKEFYNISDMIVNNLTTTSNGNLLETRGMFYISASSGKKKVKISNGKSMKVRIPAEKAGSEMELFNGEETAQGVNWVPANNPASYFYYSYSGLRNNFERAFIKDYEDLQKKIKYPEEAITRDRSGRVTVVCVVDKNGVVHNPVVLYRVSKYLSNEVISKLENYNGFEPAKINDKAVCSLVALTVEFTKYGFWKNIEVYGAYKERYDKRIDEIDPKIISNMENKLCEECEKIYSPNTEINSVANYSGYSMTIPKMGWINCDRFIKEKNLISKLSIESLYNDSVFTFMVFKQLRSIMSGTVYENKIFYNNIPVGYDVTLFCLKEKGKKLLLSKNDFTIQKGMEINIKFSEISKDDFINEIEKLN